MEIEALTLAPGVTFCVPLPIEIVPVAVATADSGATGSKAISKLTVASAIVLILNRFILTCIIENLRSCYVLRTEQ